MAAISHPPRSGPLELELLQSSIFLLSQFQLSTLFISSPP